jgi:hypothetical protein
MWTFLSNLGDKELFCILLKSRTFVDEVPDLAAIPWTPSVLNQKVANKSTGPRDRPSPA